ncbi:phage-related tail fiber protein [Chitinivorax tropicus]|uniref:Phage-related tail fiber protein n=1 Tax=Chitinivorax tropicus TaxID=714531 RepID=A0A840MLL2_9PROT|nr:phage tail protein [Chitinivorax tropicus]MBB5017426.1 phage-related tail fiber protein [Chitinivorax tropicus]
MANEFFTILTAVGRQKLANAISTGTVLTLTQMAVGDGQNGAYYLPSEDQITLKRETWRGAINHLFVSPDNPNWVVAEVVIPDEIGGFYIREVGLFDSTGALIGIGKFPESYKPALATGSNKQLHVRMILEVSNTAVITLQVDPSIVLATRQYVDDKVAAELSKLDAKQSVRLATTGNIPLSGLQVIDGITVSAGDRVLVKDQTLPRENGIYVADLANWQRAQDADHALEVTPGLFVSVEQGSTQADSIWQVMTDGPITLGTTNLQFEMIAGRTGIAAGTYRSLSVNPRGIVIGGTNPTTLAGFGITDAALRSYVDGQPNLLRNPSGELGKQCWRFNSVDWMAVHGVSGEWVFFNAPDLSGQGQAIATSEFIRIDAVPYISLSLDAYTLGVYAGKVYAEIEFFNGEFKLIGASSALDIAIGQVWRRYGSELGSVKPGTKYCRVKITLDSNKSDNFSFSRVKLEFNVKPSMYSLESRLSVPVGTVSYFSSQSVPFGWLMADGKAYSRNEYQSLFDVIGTVFGEGDKSTTFNVPDLRGEFIRGWNAGAAKDRNRVFGSSQAASLITASIGPDAIQNLVVEGVVPNTATPEEFSSGMKTDLIDPAQYKGSIKGFHHVRAAYAYSGNNIVQDNSDCDLPLNRRNEFGAGGARPTNLSLLACIKY